MNNCRELILSNAFQAIGACPGCRGELVFGDGVSCPSCGIVGHRIGDGLVQFGEHVDNSAIAIAAWSESFVRTLPAWAESGLDGADRDSLREHGVVREDGSLTPLGETIHYHLDEYRWQKGRKGLDGVLELSALGPAPRILDVGCGAAQTLRLLEPDRPVELFGIDAEPTALALGWRLADLEGIAISLAAASATRLPFRDASFDLVLTRVALNYMHQRSALAEMTRVLRPGGFLFCRVERVWHDVRILLSTVNPKTIVCGLRDLGWGMIHATTGWQATPGGKVRGSRVFASTGRLAKMLAPHDCQVVKSVESPNGLSVLGRRTQQIVVAQKAAR
jgi:SAM-dependent methyltransferase